MRTDSRLSEGLALVRLLSVLQSVTDWMCKRAKAKEPEMPTVQLKHALDLHLLQETPYVSQSSILGLLTEVGARNLLRYQASWMEPYFFMSTT